VQTLVNTLSPADLDTLTSLLNSGGLSSVTSLDGFPSSVQSVIRNAFLDGVRWSFVSLIPWLGVGTVLSVFLSKIRDSDAEGKGEEVRESGNGEREGLGQEQPQVGRNATGAQV